jgi:hypothetical protein
MLSHHLVYIYFNVLLFSFSPYSSPPNHLFSLLFTTLPFHLTFSSSPLLPSLPHRTPFVLTNSFPSHPHCHSYLPFSPSLLTISPSHHTPSLSSPPLLFFPPFSSFSSPSFDHFFSPRHFTNCPSLSLSPSLPVPLPLTISHLTISPSHPLTISLSLSPSQHLSIAPSHPHYRSLPVPSMEARPLSNILFYGAKLGTYLLRSTVDLIITIDLKYFL